VKGNGHVTPWEFGGSAKSWQESKSNGPIGVKKETENGSVQDTGVPTDNNEVYPEIKRRV